MTDTEKINELRQGLMLYRETLISTVKQRNKVTRKYDALCKLFNHYYSQYHRSRRALISSRIDKVELQAMIEALQSRNKPPDIEIGQG